MKLFEAKQISSNLILLSESALNYQTVYRFTSLGEAINLLSGLWKFNDFPFGKKFIGDGKFERKYGKSFTRNINASGIGQWQHSQVLIEIDKDALSMYSKGKIIFKPYNFWAVYSERDDKNHIARNKANEAEEIAILTSGKQYFRYNTDIAKNFIKCIYIKDDYRKSEDTRDLIKMCKKLNIKYRFIDFTNKSSRELDLIRDTDKKSNFIQKLKKFIKF